ncbi:MAG: PrsW family glutamic-type intramembrane protease [Candidatus Gracilibacteria bacterium]
MSQFLQIIGSILLACVPAYIWGYLYYKKQPEDRRHTALTFILGAIMVLPILLYKFLWQFFPSINAFRYANYYSGDLIGIGNLINIPLSVIITFMFVGVMEELLKFLPVKIVDENRLRSVDDSIEFFIIAALGFAFTENVLYFYNIWVTQGTNSLFLPFLFRSSFSTFAHIMFSGIFGYYYGTAHFAKPILQEELRAKRQLWTVALHKLFNFRQTKLFHQERLLEGLLIAVGLHALFNIFLEMNLTLIIAPFLVSGYMTLNYLFAKKENHKIYGKLFEGIRNHASPTSARQNQA